MSLRVANDTVAVTLRPEFGARITELTDLRRGRNWIAPDVPQDTAPGDDAVYVTGGHASGWDECFPTVAPCEVPQWGGALRDHGAVWGRAWRCWETDSGIAAQYEDPRFLFRRDITLLSDGMRVAYRLSNRQAAPMPWIWSQHCLLACRPGERFVTTGVGPWRDDGGCVVDPNPVRAPDAGIAGKMFATAQAGASVALRGPEGGIRFDWSGLSDANGTGTIGLWFSYGGWPLDCPLYQVAIEPTNRGFNRLSDALQAGQAAWLDPDATTAWSVNIRFTL